MRSTILVLFLMSISTDAFAFFDQPFITPLNPSVGDTIVMNVYGGGCDAILGTPGYPQITQQGNNIRTLLYGAHYDDGDDACIFGEGTAMESLGAWPPGAYSLEIDMQYISLFGGTQVLDIGTVNFEVSGAPQADAVPALNPTVLWLLAVLLATSALFSLRARKQ